MEWISINTSNDMPLETMVIVQHKYGIEAIQFFQHQWRYCYTGKPVPYDLIKSITHWFVPIRAE
jgi:hypothetical protein